MFDCSPSEIQAIDGHLEAKLGWAKDRRALSEQMALDASRLLSCTEDRLASYHGQGFFKRCWFGLSGKNGAIQRANEKDLVEMQKYAWRYINLLQERDLLAAHSIITVKNNLMTLAVEQDHIRSEISRLAERVYDRFVALDDRVGNIEASQRIHGWLLTIDTRDYDSAFPPNIRLLRVVNDFLMLKASSWNILELKYLHKALKEVGLDIKASIGIGSFIDGLIDEIESLGYPAFSTLVAPDEAGNYDDDFVIDEISAPSFNSLYQIKKNYTTSSRVIRSLQKSVGIGHPEAIKTVLSDFIAEQGIDTRIEIPLKDLATEILTCFNLAQRLITERSETLEEFGDAASDSSADSSTTFTMGGDAGEAADEKSDQSDRSEDAAEAQEGTEKSDDSESSCDGSFEFSGSLDEKKLAEIKGGNLYALLSACDNDDLEPLVKIIIETSTNSLGSTSAFKLHNPNHKKYYNEIAHEIRSFGGHSVRNLFRGSGPEYGEIVADVCDKFDIPSVEDAVLKNEDAVFNRFAPKAFEELAEDDIAATIARIREKAKSPMNNKGKAAAGVAASLISAPLTAVFLANSALSEAYRVTGPSVFYIAYLRKKVLSRANSARGHGAPD